MVCPQNYHETGYKSVEKGSWKQIDFVNLTIYNYSHAHTIYPNKQTTKSIFTHRLPKNTKKHKKNTKKMTLTQEIAYELQDASTEFWINYNYEVSQGRKTGDGVFEWLDDDEDKHKFTPNLPQPWNHYLTHETKGAWFPNCRICDEPLNPQRRQHRPIWWKLLCRWCDEDEDEEDEEDEEIVAEFGNVGNIRFGVFQKDEYESLKELGLKPVIRCGVCVVVTKIEIE